MPTFWRNFKSYSRSLAKPRQDICKLDEFRIENFGKKVLRQTMPNLKFNQMYHIIVGIWPIIYNSTNLLEEHMPVDMAQMSSFLFIVGNFLASLVGMWTVERFGRRPMLLYCGVANTAFLTMFVVCDRLADYLSHRFSLGCVVALVGYGITYGVAVGPIAAFITTELVPQRFRSLVQSIVYSVNTVFIFVLSFATLPIYRLIGVWAFIPLFVLPSAGALVYLFATLPETRGREIHEIVADLMRVSSNDEKPPSVDSMSDILTKNSDQTTICGCWPARRRADRVSVCHVDVPRIVVKSASNTTLAVTLDELCENKSKHRHSRCSDAFQL